MLAKENKESHIGPVLWCFFILFYPVSLWQAPYDLLYNATKTKGTVVQIDTTYPKKRPMYTLVVAYEVNSRMDTTSFQGRSSWVSEKISDELDIYYINDDPSRIYTLWGGQNIPFAFILLGTFFWILVGGILLVPSSKFFRIFEPYIFDFPGWNKK